MDVQTIRMDAFRNDLVARRLRAAVDGAPEAAQAADQDALAPSMRRGGRDEVTVTDLILVGGLSCVHPYSFLEGAPQ